MKSPNNDLQKQLPAVLDQLLNVVAVCLSTPSIIANTSVIKSMKWCLKINDEYCSLQATPSPILYQTLADLCLNVLFSFYSSNQIETLYN